MSRIQNRITAGILTLGVQAALLALLIFSHGAQVARDRLEPETIFLLPPLPRILSPPAPHATARPRARQPIPDIAVPQSAAPPSFNAAPAPPSADDLRNLGQGIFGCSIENWSSLRREQQAHCTRPGEGFAIQSAPDLLGTPSHVKDEAHWQAEWAREQSPALLPCGGFVDVLCLIGKIANGSLSDYGDPKTWPSYAVKPLSKEELYKLEQTYQQWHKDHPEKAEGGPAAAQADANPR
jgi:hypothetical protein